MGHLFTLEPGFYSASVYVRMLMHKHVLARIILFSGQQLLGVSNHIEPRVYPFGAEDEVTVMRYHHLLYTLTQTHNTAFSPRGVL